MVQTRTLEKAIEASIAEGRIGTHERSIDEFLNENEPISSNSSSKLHDSLYRIWTSSEVQKAKSPPSEQEKEDTLTPSSTLSLDTANLEKTEELFEAADPRVIFLEALNKLGPCLINKDQLQVWWRELRLYAIDSTGHRLDLVDQSKRFLIGVLTGSFYGHGDATNDTSYTELACSYGRNILELYLSNRLPKESKGEETSERIRIVRQNSRTLFGEFARRENKLAFTMINEYFVDPQYRVTLLDLIVEYLSESQNSKLFRIYDTPFFESLLTCLEKDHARPAIQLGITALSMLIVHICDKLVPTGLLFRIYACFGRACSWQPSNGNATNTENPDLKLGEEEDDQEEETLDDLDQGHNQGHDQGHEQRHDQGHEQRHEQGHEQKHEQRHELESDNDRVGAEEEGQKQSQSQNQIHTSQADTKETHTVVAAIISKPTENSATTDWQVLYDTKEGEATPTETDYNETVKVISVFTFLYGLFPINTLQFCRQCDEYLAKHSYQKNFSDFWSRFMVTRKAEGLVRQFRVDPLFINSTEETELSSALSRFQEVGSSLGITSICTSRRIIDVSKGEEGNLSLIDGENLQKLLNGHGQAFQMNPEGTAGYWHRELLLLRSELAFANFSRYMSEQRALRWQKRASDRLIFEGRNEELTRQNRILRSKVANLETETQRAIRSARTIMRERSAYETKILNRNREFRDKIKELEHSVLDLKGQKEAAVTEVKSAIDQSVENQNLLTRASEELRALRNDSETAKSEHLIGSDDSAVKSVPNASSTVEKTTVTELQNEISTLKFKLDKLQEETSISIKSLQSEVLAAQAEAIKAQASRPKPSEPLKRSSVSMRNLIAEKSTAINRLKDLNEELSRRCAALEHELRARKVHEEERLNELQVTLLSSRAYVPQETPRETRFRGRGGAQGVPRRN